ncbi:MAG: hypothetical protein JSV84_05355 [Gemmatimonadota bacterium]|nr:MAG: hypothetical protein JSV84_05355 [Gemmatimonadota bacterium]
MNLKTPMLSLAVVVIVSSVSPCVYAEENRLQTSMERVRLTLDEKVIYASVLEHIDQEGDIPTLETIEQALASTITNERRAKLSAKMYYENGVIGVFFSDDESHIMAYLLQHRGNLGSIRDLIRHIQEYALAPIPKARIVRGLEFLYAAGFIDVRNDGERVYFILPQGLDTLYMASSLKDRSTTHEILGQKRSDVSYSYFQEEPIPVDQAERPISPAPEDEKPTPDEGFDLHEPSRVLPTPAAESVTVNTVETFPVPEEAPPEAQEKMRSERTASDTSENMFVPKRDPFHVPEPVAAVMSNEPLGPPFSLIKTEQEEPEYSGFSRKIMEQRGKSLLPCAPDFWGWPYLYGQNDVEILTATTDTGSEVRILVKNGQLISSQPQGLIVFSEGQHGNIHFFRSEQNLHQWKVSHPDIQGETMTVSAALTWARTFLKR